jgi:hypothetical protein
MIQCTVAPSDGCLFVQLGFTADPTGQTGVAYTDISYSGINFGNKSVENGDWCTQSCSTASGGASCPNNCNCTGKGLGGFGFDCSYLGNYNENITYVYGYVSA